MLDPTGKPTVQAHAYALREELLGRLERLQDLERRIEHNAGPDNNREHIRADAVAIAIEHLQGAIDALEVAAKE